jgi:hypothetical protein
MLPLGLIFFVLSSNYRQNLIDEYYILSKFIGTSYFDFLIMPTYFRKVLVNKIIEHNTPKE